MAEDRKENDISTGNIRHVDFAQEKKKREEEEEAQKDRDALQIILEYAKTLKW